jgi:hypothetical protein
VTRHHTTIRRQPCTNFWYPSPRTSAHTGPPWWVSRRAPSGLEG